MASENSDRKHLTAIQAIYRFLGGAATGALIVSIPLTAGFSTDLSWMQISIAALLVLSCGVLASLWGEKFIDAVMVALNSFSP